MPPVRLVSGTAAGGGGRTARAVAGLRGSHGVRAGVVVGLATLVLNGAAYLFNVACIRYLGSAKYGDIAALMALTALVTLPLGSIQSVLAREVADLQARASASQIRRLLRRSLVVALPAAIVALALGLALTNQIQDALNIESAGAVAAGLSGIVFAVLAVVLYGFLQGAQRFRALGVSYALSGLARPVLVVPALLVGFGVTGALAVNALAGLVGVALAGFALRDFWIGPSGAEAPPLDRRQLAVMLCGSLAFVSLTNIDILLANHFLSDEAAGVYAAAALVGKFVLFIPSAVVTVLLPKASSRAARGVTSQGILVASAAVTAIVTLSVSAALALTPESLLVWAFGGDFRDSTALLGWFGLAMTAAALLNTHLSVYFAYRDVRFPLLLAAAAVAQVVAIVLWHPNPRAIVLVTLVCFATLLVVHEVAFPHALVRMWRDRRARIATLAAGDA